MPLPKCCFLLCKNPGVQTLQMEVRPPGATLPHTIMFKFPVCVEHTPTEEEVNKIIDKEWETICMSLETVGQLRPDRSLNVYKWVPWVDAELFYAEMEGERLTKVHKQ